MNRFVGILLLSFYAQIAVAQSGEHITELRGCSSPGGEAQLFYRVANTDHEASSIRHLNPVADTDSTYLAGRDDGMLGWTNTWVPVSFATFDCDPARYLAVYQHCEVECLDSIMRYDESDPVFQGWGWVTHLFVADSGRVYARLEDMAFDAELAIISRDSGVTWPNHDDLVDGTYQSDEVIGFPLTSVSPLGASLMFGVQSYLADGRIRNALHRSTDAGLTWDIALDPSPAHGLVHYDADAETVYMLDARSGEGGYRLLASSALGAEGSWVIAHEAHEPLVLAVDEHRPAELVLAEGNAILSSYDNGQTFTTDYVHHRPVIGLFRGASCTYFADEVGIYSICSNKVTSLAQVAVGLSEGTILPESIEITAYPNPFAEQIRVTYPRAGHAARDFEVVDLTGRVVARLRGQVVSAEAESVVWAPSGDVAAGVYLLKPVVARAGLTVKVVYSR